MIPIILHTHSDYSDVWKITIPLLEKYASDFTIYWCSDSLLNFKLPNNFIFIKYDNCLNWSARFKDCIDLFDSEYFIYTQEDSLLIDYIDKNTINYLLDFMIKNKVDFLMSYNRSSSIPELLNQIPIPCVNDGYEFRKISGHYNQPAIWNKNLFKKIIALNVSLKNNEDKIVNDITESANCYGIIWTKTQHITTTTLYFKHIHSIHGGQWLLIKYPYKLLPLLESYGIDYRRRGISPNWNIPIEH
jgi:hypothetical protein